MERQISRSRLLSCTLRGSAAHILLLSNLLLASSATEHPSTTQRREENTVGMHMFGQILTTAASQWVNREYSRWNERRFTQRLITINSEVRPPGFKLSSSLLALWRWPCYITTLCLWTWSAKWECNQQYLLPRVIEWISKMRKRLVHNNHLLMHLMVMIIKTPSHLSTLYAANEVTNQRKNVFHSLIDSDKALNGAWSTSCCTLGPWSLKVWVCLTHPLLHSTVWAWPIKENQ